MNEHSDEFTIPIFSDTLSELKRNKKELVKLSKKLFKYEALLYGIPKNHPVKNKNIERTAPTEDEIKTRNKVKEKTNKINQKITLRKVNIKNLSEKIATNIHKI